MAKIKTEIGKKIENDVCDECKAKIAEMSSKLSKLDLIRPTKIARRFAAALCPKCTNAVIRRMRQEGKGGKR